jgi:hypothetical protein
VTAVAKPARSPERTRLKEPIRFIITRREGGMSNLRMFRASQPPDHAGFVDPARELAQVVHRSKFVHGRVESLIPRLELQREEEGVVA